MLHYEEMEKRLEAEKFEESLKLSILEKKNEMAQKSKLKQQFKPTMITSLFKFKTGAKPNSKTIGLGTGSVTANSD